jgi:hypothetical protein
MSNTRSTVPPLPIETTPRASVVPPDRANPPLLPPSITTVDLPPEIAESPRRGPGWFLRAASVVGWLLFGTSSHFGFTGSVVMHTLGLAVLALIIMPMAQEDEPPMILSASNGVEDLASIGESVSDVTSFEVAPQSVSQVDVHSAIGGSFGTTEPSLSGLSGEPSGLGRGSGTGVGDGAGADIAGRVEAAGGKGGALQISLAWDDTNDLDLAVQTPEGEVLYWGDLTTSDGGELDVDMNALGSVSTSKKAVENIAWPGTIPPDGEYLVRVHFFGARPRQPQQPEFRVRLQVAGEVRVLAGRLEQVQQYLLVARFTLKDSKLESVDTTLKPFEGEVAAVPNNPENAKRAAARESSARKELSEAIATADANLKKGKLRRVIDRFAGTEAAAEAQRLLGDVGE